jgi:hypothetical protein
MPLNTEDLYRAHVKNLRAVETACAHIYLELKRCLAIQQVAAADALLKTFVLLIGAWSEVRLQKLFHENNGFSDAERSRILALDTKLEQWKVALEIGFRRRYGVPNAILSKQSLPPTAFLRYQEINRLIDNDLRPIIEIRNKLAHGQWARTLNSEMTDISPAMMALLNSENALSANFKKKIIEALSRIVNDLIVGGIAFDRDFDIHYRVLEQTRTNLKTRVYEEWVLLLQTNFKRGSARRQGANANAP